MDDLNTTPPARAIGRRIVVYGNSGSGKSTLARALGARLSLPAIELDAIYHARPGWDDLSREEFRERVAEVLDEHSGGWVIDGNYSVARDLVLPLAETAIWLKLPFRVVYRRLWWRTMKRLWTRELLWGSNRETFHDVFLSRESMLVWGVTHWRQTRCNLERDLATVPHSAQVVVLRSRREVEALLASCC